MTSQIARIGGVFLMTLAVASLGLTGSASAFSASISSTGPGSLNVITSGSSQHWRNKSCAKWSSWNPHTWRKDKPGHFNEWRDGVTKFMKQCKQSSWPKKDWRVSHQPKVLGHSASIHLTGPGSTNVIKSSFAQGGSSSISNTGPRSTNIVKNAHGGSGSISTTGPGSTNIIKSTHGGDSISTTGPGSTNKIVGGHWDGQHGSQVTTRNTNNVSVSNTTRQEASTGNAVVKGNTHGGSATSGDATNSSSVSTEVSIRN